MSVEVICDLQLKKQIAGDQMGFFTTSIWTVCGNDAVTHLQQLTTLKP